MKRIAFGLLCCFMLLTTGCTKNQDLQDLGMMSGISYDVAENGEFLYTCQIGRGDGVVTLEGKSDTMGSIGGEALRSTGVIAYRLNLNLVVISEEAARRGVQQIISALYTYEGSSGEEQIVIAKGSAKELLATENTETAEHNLLEMLTHFGSSSAFANCFKRCVCCQFPFTVINLCRKQMPALIIFHINICLLYTSINGIMAYPPPMVNMPIFANV